MDKLSEEIYWTGKNCRELWRSVIDQALRDFESRALFSCAYIWIFRDPDCQLVCDFADVLYSDLKKEATRRLATGKAKKNLAFFLHPA